MSVVAEDSAGSSEPPAIQKLIHTTEILEKVLLELDTKTLLLSQRVCKTFKEIVDDSMYLQEALFFRQAPASRAAKYGEGGVNPLLTWPWQRELGLKPIYNTSTEPAQFFAFPDEKPVGYTVRMGSWRRMCFIHGVPSDENDLGTEIVKFYENGAIRKEGFDLDSDGCVRLVEGGLELVRFDLMSGKFFWDRVGGRIVPRREGR
ncbi:hypothetical protein PRZ48_014662 [Zasmidium cellare]|uniref:F-box domain-containing protein n=1 Tax=Zasmidium cellare TaxID=395010 RepID=A0ABR0DYX3_ZASCE|nr:hypothetical protein PRZ48_014662 [Zasmidium cellare]